MDAFDADGSAAFSQKYAAVKSLFEFQANPVTFPDVTFLPDSCAQANKHAFSNTIGKVNVKWIFVSGSLTYPPWSVSIR